MSTTTTTTTTTTTADGVTTTTTTTVTTTAAGVEEAEPPAAATDRCLMNTFGGTINTFPRMSADFDKEWLSAALNAPVESFELRYAGEGQTALTFVLHSIEYAAGARDGLPSSVAIKIHAESEGQRTSSSTFRLYDKETYLYTKLQDTVPLRMCAPRITSPAAAAAVARRSATSLAHVCRCAGPSRSRSGRTAATAATGASRPSSTLR